MEYYKSAFRVRLRLLMKENNMTQQQVADHFGIKRQSVSLWCSGKTEPSASKVAMLSNMFGVTSDFLLGISGSRENKVTKESVAQFIGTDEATVDLMVRLIAEMKGV